MNNIFSEKNMPIICEAIRDTLFTPRIHNLCKEKHEKQLQEVLNTYLQHLNKVKKWEEEVLFCKEWGIETPKKPCWNEVMCFIGFKKVVVKLFEEIKKEYKTDDLLLTYIGFTKKDIDEVLSGK